VALDKNRSPLNRRTHNGQRATLTERDAPLESVRAPLFAWLTRWHLDASAVYLTKSVSRLNDLPSEVVRAIALWSEAHRTSEDALFRVSRISRYVTRVSAEDPAIADIRRAGWAVLSSSLSLRFANPQNRDLAAGLLLQNLSRVAEDSAWMQDELAALFEWAQCGSVFFRGSKVQPSQTLLRAIARAFAAREAQTASLPTPSDPLIAWLSEHSHRDAMAADLLNLLTAQA
jgi:hypothetical protein